MIIGLSGLAGSGKSTVARFLVERRAFVEISLAAPMKRIVQDLFAFSDMQLYGPSSARNDVDPRYGVSPRHVLQTLGTDWGRACWPDVWVSRVIRQAAEYPAVVVPDCRFKNELAAIRAAGGKLWRLTHGRGLDGAAGAHESEREQLGIPDDYFDRVFAHDSTLAELEDAVIRSLDT